MKVLSPLAEVPGLQEGASEVRAVVCEHLHADSYAHAH